MKHLITCAVDKIVPVVIIGNLYKVSKDSVCKIGRYSSGNGINPPGSLLPL